MSYEQKSSRRDHLTSTTKDGKIELTEEQSSRVGGGYSRSTHLKVRADEAFPGALVTRRAGCREGRQRQRWGSYFRPAQKQTPAPFVG
jgi:hypothetical protein